MENRQDGWSGPLQAHTGLYDVYGFCMLIRHSPYPFRNFFFKKSRYSTVLSSKIRNLWMPLSELGDGAGKLRWQNSAALTSSIPQLSVPRVPTPFRLAISFRYTANPVILLHACPGYEQLASIAIEKQDIHGFCPSLGLFVKSTRLEKRTPCIFPHEECQRAIPSHDE
jgi:hypothetical protein